MKAGSIADLAYRLALSCIFLLAVTLGSIHTLASPLPPNVRASQSANGRFLVVSYPEYGPLPTLGGKLPDATAPQTMESNTYEIFMAEAFVNNTSRLSGGVTFWSDSALSWSIKLEREQLSTSGWPILSNDGRTLVLVATAPPLPGSPVLSIYKMSGFRQGALLRNYQIDDLWTSHEIDPERKDMVMATDATPSWFAGSTFSFSPNCGELVYTNKWHETLSISLSDGNILRPSR